MASDDDSGLQITWGRALIPLSLFAFFILKFVFGVPLWVLALLTLWIPLYYVAYPWYLERKWNAFEKEFAIRFQQGDFKGLLEYYKDQWFLRRFGPRAYLLDKLGLIYSALEKYRKAEEIFEKAVDAADDSIRDKLLFNLANVKYELGKYDDAEQIYRSLEDGSPYQHQVRTQKALIDLQRGRRVEEARALLEREKQRTTGLVKRRIEKALD